MKNSIFNKVLSGIPDYKTFFTVDELNNSSKALAVKYPNIVKLIKIGSSRNGDPIYCLKIGNGSKNTLLYGCPHPNEPVGAMMLEYLSTALAEDLSLRKELDYTWYITKTCDPDGTRLNEGWFKGPFTIKNYVRNFFRPVENQQVDWTFPINYKNWHFNGPMPETKALMALVESIKPTFIYALHNEAFGGAFWYMTEANNELYEAIVNTAKKQNIPIFAGEAEMECFEEVYHTIYKLQSMRKAYDYFDNMNADPTIFLKSGTNCSDYCGNFCKCFSLVTEVPYFYDQKLFDYSKSDTTKRNCIIENQKSLKEIKSVILSMQDSIEEYISSNNPFRSALEMFSTLPTPSKAKMKTIEESEQYSEFATEAEKFTNLVAMKLYYVLGLGILTRTFEYELKKIHKEHGDNTELINRLTLLQESSERTMLKYVSQIEEKTDYTAVSINKLIRIQLESGLICMSYLDGK